MRLSKKEILYIAAAIIFNIFIIIIIYRKFAIIGTDGAVYAMLGKNIIEGQGITLYGQPHTIFSPLLPFFIGLFFIITNNLDLSAHLATIFFGLISLPLLYIATKEFASKKEALVALVLYSFSGHLLLNYVRAPSAQIAAGFFSILTFLSLLKISKMKEKFGIKNASWILLCGMAIGLSYLARPEYIIMVVPAAIYLFFIFIKSFSKKKTAAALLLFLMGFFIISFPYFVFLKNSLGYWTFTGRGSEMLLINAGQQYESVLTNPEGDSAMFTPPRLHENAFKTVFSNIGGILKEFIKNLLSTQAALISYWGFVGIVFLVYGLRNCLVKKRLKELIIILISFIPVLVIALARPASASYLAQFFYLFIILIAIGFCCFSNELSQHYKLKERAVKLISGSLITVLSFFLLSVLIIRLIFTPAVVAGRDEFKTMGLWMRENIANIEQEAVLARKPDVSFYAGAEWKMILKDTTVFDAVEMMRKSEIKYIIIDNRHLPTSRPELIDLLDPRKAPDDLELIKRVDFYDKHVLLYKL